MMITVSLGSESTSSKVIQLDTGERLISLQFGDLLVILDGLDPVAHARAIIAALEEAVEVIESAVLLSSAAHDSDDFQESLHDA